MFINRRQKRIVTGLEATSRESYMRTLTDAEQYHHMLRRAPELALSGTCFDAEEVALQLKEEGVDVRRHLSPDTYSWLNELCQRALVQAAE